MSGRNTKRRFLLPLLIVLGSASVLGPVALVFGTARSDAAFGDNETIGVNRLSSATVDVEVGRRSVRLVGENLAPGDRTIGSIEIVNVGTLPLRYALVAEPSTEPLLGWLTWDLWEGAGTSGCGSTTAARRLVAGLVLQPTDGAVLGDVAVGLDRGDRIIEPGAIDTICVAARFGLDAPDSLQGRRLDQTWTVVAEQHTDAKHTDPQHMNGVSP